MSKQLQNKISDLEKKVKILEGQNRRNSARIKRLQDIYENTTIGLYQTNLDGKVLLANKPLIDMLGFDSLKDLQKANLNKDELMHSYNRKSFIKLMEKEDIIIGREVEWLKKDGEVIYIRESAKTIRDNNGKIILFEGTIEDITIQKTKEKALLESESRYKRLVDLFPYGVVIHKDDKIIYTNEQTRNILKIRSPKSLETKTIFDYIEPSFHKQAKARLKTSLSSYTTARTKEQVYITDSGNKIDVEVTTIPLKYVDKTSFLTVISDISDRKLAEKELRLSDITYRGILNSISEAIFIQDFDGKFIDVNKTAEKAFGYDNNFFIGKSPKNLSAGDINDLDEILKKVRSAYNGKREHLKFWGKSSNGDIFPTEVNLSAGIYFDKKAVIAILRDVTDRESKDTMIRESEQKYKDLIDFAVGGIIVGDSRGYIINANSYMRTLFGRKRKDIIGKHISDGFFTEESLTKSPLLFEELKNGKTVINERNIIRPDNTIVPIEMHTKMLPDETFQTIYHDISERKKAYKEKEEANKHVEMLNRHKEAILRAIPDMLFTFDKSGKIIDFYANTHLKQKLIESPETFLNKNIYEVLPLELAETTYSYIQKVLKTKRMNKYIYKLVINNETRHYDAKMVYLNENTSMALVRDITERVNLIDDLEVAKKKAEESDKLKSAFLSNLSHEIRTPMNGILGFTDLLKDNISQEEKIEYLEIIESSSNQLLLVLDDIIEISKIDAGILTKKVETIDIDNFIKGIYKQMKILIPKDKDISLSLAENIPTNQISSVTDPTKLGQILTNFISNAFKFTEKGLVEIGYSLISDTHIKFYVKDSGQGISKDNINKIFQRFIQIENKFNASNHGSGLGLSICKAYAKILDGSISVDSELEKGSCFSVIIPIISYS